MGIQSLNHTLVCQGTRFGNDKLGNIGSGIGGHLIIH